MSADLTKPSAVAALLGRHGLRPSKGLGQNFLVDARALEKILGAAEVSEEDICLEIGPGLGTLTRELCRLGRQVVAIEKDRKLTPVLAETLIGCTNLEIIWGDALKVDIAEILAPYAPPYKVVANLPYYITTPILMGLLESGLQWSRLVFLMQREVALRIVAKAGTADYGALSVAVGYYAEAEVVANISPASFFPRPKVSSTVLLLRARENPDMHFGALSRRMFFATLRAAFGQRRKTLLNALSNGEGMPDKEALRLAISAAGLDEGVRGETLSVEEFVRLSNEIYRVRG